MTRRLSDRQLLGLVIAVAASFGLLIRLTANLIPAFWVMLGGDDFWWGYSAGWFTVTLVILLPEPLANWWLDRREARETEAALKTPGKARIVQGMTTTDTDRVTKLTGELIYSFFEEVPDDQVIDAAKAFVHTVLDNGYAEPKPGEPPMSSCEQIVWELVPLLGFTPITDPWKIESAIFQLIDGYDLFND